MQGGRVQVFLSHHSADDAAVERIAEWLRGEGVEPWLEMWCLTPGKDWQQGIAEGLRASAACAVFVGSQGLGDWVRLELAVAADRAAKDDNFRLFMVLLPGAPRPDDPSLDFLLTRRWVDLREGIDDPAALQRLARAVTGTDRPDTVTAEQEEVRPYRGLEVFDEAHAQFFFGRLRRHAGGREAPGRAVPRGVRPIGLWERLARARRGGPGAQAGSPAL